MVDEQTRTEKTKLYLNLYVRLAFIMGCLESPEGINRLVLFLGCSISAEFGVEEKILIGKPEYLSGNVLVKEIYQ